MTITQLTLPAPAKLNLFLHIIGRRADGYHELQTIFQLLDFCDELRFEKRTTEGLRFTCSDASLENDSNLVVKAVKALEKAANRTLNVNIHLDKKLPMGGGIGGGSSDCATTLLGLNALFELNLTEKSLRQIGQTLGADVPVFIHGQTTWAEGIGEQLTDIDLPSTHYVLIHPNIHISTADLFRHDELTRNTALSTIRTALAETGRNDFEPLVRKLYPEIDQAFLQCASFGTPKLTGTGACFFIKVPDSVTAKTSAEKIQRLNPLLRAWATRSVSRSAVQTRLKQFR